MGKLQFSMDNICLIVKFITTNDKLIRIINKLDAIRACLEHKCFIANELW